MNKYSFSIFFIIILLLTTSTSCGSLPPISSGLDAQTPALSETPLPSPTFTPIPTQTPTPDYSLVKVLFFVNGTLGDRFYFDLFAEGIQAAQQKYGFNLQIVESGWGASNYIKSFSTTLANEPYNIVVAVGDAMRWSVQTEAAKYPNTNFLLLDGKIDVNLSNVFSAPININKAAYLAGMYAGTMTMQTSIQGINASSKIGAIGIGNDPQNYLTLMSFRNGGMDAGLALQDITIETIDVAQKIKDTERIATQMYSNGADIIFLFSGRADLGGAKAAFDLGHYIIGMGKDYASMLSSSNNELVGNVLTSVVMHPEQIALDAVSKAIENTLPYGSMISYGIDEGYVGLVKNEGYEELTPLEVKEQISLAEKDFAKPEVLFVINQSWEDDLYSGSMRKGYEQAANQFDLPLDMIQLETNPDELDAAWESLFIDNTFDILITSGEETVERITYFAQKYPNIKFILIGGKIDFYSNFLPNVYSVAFRTNEAFYLAGLYANLMTLNTSVPFINPESMLGVVAGVQEKPYLENRIKAFKQGATDSGMDVNNIIVDYTGGFLEMENATETANRLFTQNTDILMSLAGPAEEGILQAAQNDGFYVIGYSALGDQFDSLYTPEQAQVIITTVYENRPAVILDVLTKISTGNINYGQLDTLGLSSGMIGLVKSTTYESLTPESIQAEMLTAEEKIINHQIFIIPEFYPGLFY